MSCNQKKRDWITISATLLIIAVLAWGLLWFAESNIERAMFCAGIILMLICVTLSKASGLIYVFIICMFFTICYTCKNLIPILYYSNSNLDFLSTNSAWSNLQNEYCDPYGADALMYTIFFNKKCILNPDGYYYNYAMAMFKDVITDDSIPVILRHEDYVGNNNFEKIGISLARNHVLLFTDTGIPTNDVAYVFVNPVNLDESANVVLMNDHFGNIYIMAESEWRNE